MMMCDKYVDELLFMKVYGSITNEPKFDDLKELNKTFQYIRIFKNLWKINA